MASSYARLPETDVTITGGATEAKQDTIITNQNTIISELQRDFIDRARVTASITTGAFTLLVGSTSAVIGEFSYFNSTGETLELAVGPGAGEVVKNFLYPGGDTAQKIRIPAGSRVSVRAVSATTSGVDEELSIDFMG